MVTRERLVIRWHAAQRMAQFALSVDDVLVVLNDGRTIREYAEDRPFPSRLMLAFIDEQPVHVVAATDPATETTYLITVYRPDPASWDETFTVRITQ